ncbi:hypothetical protein FOYG_04015 [Fusarium oxysporum NRRL 32931]|uniref:Uncharacterized protein n=1 Tax=Fusarium oxysporum NRRL 32931 TaxID=660029 RepID=W9IJS5_FUSOX|nr:hypothetical protein FOYG_04015 [Fusarium oxysporum NRRL 32931]
MALQLLCQFVLITTICALWHRSNTNNGHVTVGDNRDPSFDSRGFHPPPILNSSIVWATVPAWIMSAYSSLWSAMLDSLKKVYLLLELEKENQKHIPFVEILTLLLDYGEWPVINGIRAALVGHVLLGFCLLLRAGLWTAGGLTAAIFATALVPSETPATLYSTQYFDEYLGWNEGRGASNSSITPAFDIVSATVLRSVDDYLWTTETHSFLPFVPVNKNAPGNYTFKTEAYSSTVNCTIATEDDLVKIGGIRLDLEEGDELDSAQLRFGFQSDGCNVNKWFTITNNTLQYARTWSADCGLSSGRASFGMFSGNFNATERFRLSNLTVITCQPLVYKSNVTLEMSFPNNTATPKVIRFSETSKQQIYWLRIIPRYSVFDPMVYNDMDTFSRLVIGLASREPTLDTLPEKQQIANFFGIVFAALFSNFVTLQGYSNAPKREIVSTLSRLRLRLFVVKSAALATVIILATTFVTTVILAISLHRNRHIISSYMDLLLGTAVLLRNGNSSGLESFLDDLVNSGNALSPGLNRVDIVKLATRRPDLKDYIVWAEGTPRTLHVKQP